MQVIRESELLALINKELIKLPEYEGGALFSKVELASDNSLILYAEDEPDIYLTKIYIEKIAPMFDEKYCKII
ncbi:hypothetical protein D7V21_16235 [Acinetobacter guerrae]|uniref:Uncharacterized protein n=1 Tax=Acinetobacter guerrae TaxID=1843371 RepID=A0A3A8EHR0_9GAMM|nr:hypothetical protein [Acinetobacter guerrae]RKG30290.1 hypothetical protein D7V21_16235 [Acinetobacter guerrae]